MARSIVLRFAAQCFDCGSSLPAGTTARWFGRGLVSCCPLDADGKRRAQTATDSGARPLPPLPSSASPQVRKFVADASAELDRAARAPQPLPVAQANADGLSAALQRALVEGLSPAQVAELATLTPILLLLVRLRSGARLIVPARDAVHVCACIAESCRDHVRDVTRAP